MNTHTGASALLKTLKTFGASVLLFGMIATSFPITAFAQEAVVPEVVTETTEAPLECAEGQVLNEAGDACVDEAPAPVADEGEVQGLQTEEQQTETADKTNICHKTSSTQNPWEAQRINTSAWATHQGHGDFLYAGPVNPQNQQPTSDEWCEENAPEEPQDPPYEDTTDDGQCVIVSNTLTKEGADAAVLVSNPHSAWTAVLSSVSKWIWGEDPTALTPGVDETETFTRTFSVDDASTGATLDIAADNSYVVTINGNPVGADAGEFNYTAGGKDSYSIPAGDLLVGENTIEFVVTNKNVNGETPASNPAGLRYVLTVNGADCGEPEETPENTCLAPSTLEVESGVDVSGSSLQNILDGGSYGVDADDDQTGTQQWNGSGNDVDFTVEFVSKNANNKHVFGYVQNGGAFVPVFKDDASIGAPYAGVPVQSAGPWNLSLTGVSDVVFAIHDVTSGTFYYTKTSLNTSDNKQHAVVYNPGDNQYVIAFEDLPSQGDKDFNDLVVEVTVTGCETPEDSITVVATKIVCSDESYLPNVMGANHITDADTAADFLGAVNDGHEEPVCWLESGWQFEWANNGPDGGNTTVGHVEGYTTSGLTGEDGTVSMTIPLVGGDEIHLREVLQEGYIPFKGGTNDTVSAEFACANDGLNYDNWDFIRNPEEGETYYCVAWNAEEEDETPICDPKVNLVANGSFEAPDVTNGAGWDVFEVGTSPALVWLADFLGAAPGGKVEIHGGVNGWLASDGTQYTELDSDLNGPSSPGGQSAVEIAQGLTTVTGQKYRVSYDFSARPGTVKEQNAVTVSVNGTPMQTTNAAAATAGNQTEWDTYGFDFTATGALTTLALRDAGSANDSLGSFVDNVSVTCVPEEEDETGTLVIEKYTEGGDGSFTFQVDKEYVVKPTLSPEVSSGIVVTTSEGFGDESLELEEGWYDVSEIVPEGWDLTGSYCTEGDDDIRVDEVAYDGESVYVEEGETVTCRFYNEAEEGGGEDTSEIIVVTDSNPNGWSLLNYDVSNDFDGPVMTTSGTDGYFVFGPGTAPMGDGSFEQFVVDGNDATRLVTSDYNGTPLGDITSMAYETYVTANGGAQATYIQIRIDKDGNGSWDDALFFEPVYQNGTYGMLYGQPNVPNQCGANPNCVTLGEWQSWDLDQGGWWSNVDSAGGPPLTTLAEYVDQYPNAKLATDVPAIRIQAGFGAPVWSNFEGNFDEFVIAVDGGASTHTTTYDFEPEQTPSSKDLCLNLEGTQSEVPNGYVQNEDGDCEHERGSSGGSNRRAGGGGEVLGATTCGPLLTKYLHKDWNNDPAEVTKLQEFLNSHLGLSLPVSGFFGNETFEAVKQFQTQYWQDVLKPWFGRPDSGIANEGTPTGFVYQTTRWQINNIWCPGSEAFPDTLI